MAKKNYSFKDALAEINKLKKDVAVSYTYRESLQEVLAISYTHIDFIMRSLEALKEKNKDKQVPEEDKQAEKTLTAVTTALVYAIHPAYEEALVMFADSKVFVEGCHKAHIGAINNKLVPQECGCSMCVKDGLVKEVK
jgi:hypothetical protein